MDTAKIIDAVWFSLPDKFYIVGIITTKDEITDEIKYRIGIGKGHDEGIDAYHIAEWGARFYPEIFNKEQNKMTNQKCAMTEEDKALCAAMGEVINGAEAIQGICNRDTFENVKAGQIVVIMDVVAEMAEIETEYIYSKYSGQIISNIMDKADNGR